MNNFPTKNLKSIRIISATLSQPVAIACYSREDKELVSGLESIIRENGFTSADVMSWCKDKELLFSACRMPVNGSRKFQQGFRRCLNGI